MPRRAARQAALAVVRTHEATGSSTKSWDRAVRDALARGAKEAGGKVIGFEVTKLAGESSGRRIRSYRATVRVAYRDRVSGP